MRSLRLLTIVSAISAVVLLYVWGQVDVVRVGYALEDLSKRQAALAQEHDLLQLKLSQLTAPDRIAAEAERRLRMKPPAPGQVVLIGVAAAPGSKKEQQHGEEHLRLAGRVLSQ